MFGKIARRFSTIAVLVVALAGVTTAAAASSTIYRLSGQPIGSVSTVAAGGSLQATITITSGQVGATYAICVTDPFLQADGACPPTGGGVFANPVVTCVPVTLPDGTSGCLPTGTSLVSTCFQDPLSLIIVCNTSGAGTIAAGTVTIGPNGTGTATITVPQSLSVAIFVVTNTSNPGDNGQAVVVGP